jgi:periplasmic protein TonB
MQTMSPNLASTPYAKTALMTRVIVFALVISAHLAILLAWSIDPHDHVVTTHEMAMSFTVEAQPRQTVTPQLHKAVPAVLPLPEQVAEQSAPAMVEQAAVAAPASVAAAVTAIPDTEPDYKATYLNNPSPTYPMVARRMGLQGRVVLNVEVLASGVCGEINIQKSSGYAMLDNAALQTVKSWRFMPARQAGHAVNKWFMIPIQFSLKDNAA